MEIIEGESGEHVKIGLVSGKRLIFNKVLYSIDRKGATKSLNLESAGITPDERGRLKLNKNYQTKVPHNYAVGDLIGFPSLASMSMEQGRIVDSLPLD